MAYHHYLSLYSPWVLHIREVTKYIWKFGMTPVHHKASTYTGQHNTERCIQASIPLVGFKPTVPVSKQTRPTPKSVQPAIRWHNSLIFITV